MFWERIYFPEFFWVYYAGAVFRTAIESLFSLHDGRYSARPPVHSVRPARTCSDTVYDAHAPRFLAALSHGLAIGLNGVDSAEHYGEPN